MRIDHPANRFEGSLGAPFLDETDDCVEQHHRNDDRGIDDVADRGGECGRGEQDVDQKVVELEQEAHQRAPLLDIGKTVRAVAIAARGGLVSAQATMRIHDLLSDDLAGALRVR